MAYQNPINSLFITSPSMLNYTQPNSDSKSLLGNLEQFTTTRGNSKTKVSTPSKSKLFRELGIKISEEKLGHPKIKLIAELDLEELGELETQTKKQVRAISLDNSKVPKVEKKVGNESPLSRQSRSQPPDSRRKLSSKKSSSTSKAKYNAKVELSKPVLSENLKKSLPTHKQRNINDSGNIRKAPLKIPSKKYKLNLTTGTIKSGPFSQETSELKAKVWAISALENEHLSLSLKEKIVEFAKTENEDTTGLPGISHQKEQIEIKMAKKNTSKHTKIRESPMVLVPVVHQKSKTARIPRSKITKPNPLSLDLTLNDELFKLNMSRSFGLPSKNVDHTTGKHDELLKVSDLNSMKNERNQRKNGEKSSVFPNTATHEIIKKRPSGKPLKERKMFPTIVKMKEQRIAVKPSKQKMMANTGLNKSYLIQSAFESIRANIETNRKKLDFNGVYGREIKRVLGKNINRLTMATIKITPKSKIDSLPGSFSKAREFQKSMSSEKISAVQKETNIRGIGIEAPKTSKEKDLSGESSDFSLYYRIIEDALDNVMIRNTEADNCKDSYACKSNRTNYIDESEYETTEHGMESEEKHEEFQFYTYEENLDETNSQLESEMSVSSFGDFDEPSPIFLQTLGSVTSLSKDNDPTVGFADLDKSALQLYEQGHIPPNTTLPNKMDYNELSVNQEIPKLPEETSKNIILSQWGTYSAPIIQSSIRQIKSYERVTTKGTSKEILGLKGTRSFPTLEKQEKVTAQLPYSKSTIPISAKSEDIQDIYLNEHFDYSIANFVCVDLDAKPGTSNLRETSARSYKPPWKNSEFKLLLELKQKHSDESPESVESSLSDDE